MQRYAVALTGDPTAAQDLVQDCVERALRKWSLRKASVPLRPWLFRMMRNLHVSHWRSERRHREAVALDDAPELLPTSGGQEENAELNRLLARVMQLPDEQREVLILVTVEGFTYAETAAILDVPDGTVMSRLSRARAYLRAQIEPTSRPRLRTVK